MITETSTFITHTPVCKPFLGPTEVLWFLIRIIIYQRMKGFEIACDTPTYFLKLLEVLQKNRNQNWLRSSCPCMSTRYRGWVSTLRWKRSNAYELRVLNLRRSTLHGPMFHMSDLTDAVSAVLGVLWGTNWSICSDVQVCKKGLGSIMGLVLYIPKWQTNCTAGGPIMQNRGRRNASTWQSVTTTTCCI